MSDIITALWLIVELLRLGKTSKIIKSNHQPITSLYFHDLRSVFLLWETQVDQRQGCENSVSHDFFIYSFFFQETESATESFLCWRHACAYSAKSDGSLSFSCPLPLAEICPPAPHRTFKLVVQVLELRWAGELRSCLEGSRYTGLSFSQMFLPARHGWMHILLLPSAAEGGNHRFINHLMSSVSLPFPTFSYRLVRKIQVATGCA